MFCFWIFRSSCKASTCGTTGPGPSHKRKSEIKMKVGPIIISRFFLAKRIKVGEWNFGLTGPWLFLLITFYIGAWPWAVTSSAVQQQPECSRNFSNKKKPAGRIQYRPLFIAPFCVHAFRCNCVIAWDRCYDFQNFKKFAPYPFMIGTATVDVQPPFRILDVGNPEVKHRKGVFECGPK